METSVLTHATNAAPRLGSAIDRQVAKLKTESGEYQFSGEGARILPPRNKFAQNLPTGASIAPREQEEVVGC
jgi:hypothetical protein